MLKTLALGAAASYAGLAGLLWFAQDSLLFYPQPSGGAPVPPPGWSLEEVRHTAPDGVTIAGVLVKPPLAVRMPLVIVYGGNAEEITAQSPGAQAAYGSRAVLLVNYRGYGRSEGTPGEQAIVADSLALYDWAAARPDIDPARIALAGRSLGTGVAVQVAAQRPVKCVVLTSPYDSIRAVAKSHYPYFPVGLLLRHPFDSAARAPALRMPALMLYGDRDTIIGHAHSEKLAALWGGTVEHLRLEGRGHNDLGLDPRYAAAIAGYLDRHL